MADAPIPFRSAAGELFRMPLFWVATVAAVATVATSMWLARADRQPSDERLPTYGVVPAFSFRDQTGAAFTDRDLRGKVVIASFVFTRCPTVCPVVSLKMQRIGERLADDRGILLVSFSVDPAHDTPPVLAAFASRYGADPGRWKFLTGDPAAIRSTVEGSLKIAMDLQGDLAGGVPDIVHGTHLVLIDGAATIRGYYDYSDPQRIEALVRDAAALTP